MCGDTHDCSIATGDRWLQAWFQKLVASPAYQSGTTALFITWDEDDHSEQNHIATIIVSPITPAGVRSEITYDHYSLLRTTEALLGIDSHLGNAATAASMRGVFFPEPGTWPLPLPELRSLSH